MNSDAVSFKRSKPSMNVAKVKGEPKFEFCVLFKLAENLQTVIDEDFQESFELLHAQGRKRIAGRHPGIQTSIFQSTSNIIGSFSSIIAYIPPTPFSLHITEQHCLLAILLCSKA